MLYINSLTFHDPFKGGAHYLRFVGGRFKLIKTTVKNKGTKKVCPKCGYTFCVFLM